MQLLRLKLVFQNYNVYFSGSQVSTDVCGLTGILSLTGYYSKQSVAYPLTYSILYNTYYIVLISPYTLNPMFIPSEVNLPVIQILPNLDRANINTRQSTPYMYIQSIHTISTPMLRSFSHFHVGEWSHCYSPSLS